jgi:DNA-binding winged helix-turn-helix (wHTH) protein
MENDRYCVGDLVVEPSSGFILRQDEEIRVSRLTFQLLIELVKRAPRVVSTQELLDALWPDTVVADESLKQRVHMLRKALGDDAGEPRYLETVRGCGYRLTAEVRVAREQTGQSPDNMFEPEMSEVCEAEMASRVYSRAERWLGRMEFGKCAALLEQVVSYDPTSVAAWTYLAWARIWLEQLDAARQALQTALGLLEQATPVERHFTLASQSSLNGDLAAAIDHYQLLLEERPAHYWARINLAGCYWLAGRPDEAEASYRSCFELFPDDPLTHWNLGVMALNRCRNLNLVEAFFAPVRKQLPQHPFPLPWMTQVFRAWVSGNLHEARTHLDALLTRRASLPALGQLTAYIFDARLALASGCTETAIRALQQGLRLVREGASWHGWCSVELALVMADAGRVGEGERILTDLSGRGSSLFRGQAHGWLAVLAARQGREDEARRELAELDQLEYDGGWSAFPERPGFQLALTVFPLLVDGILLHTRSRPEEAIGCFEQVERLVPLWVNVVPVVGIGPRVRLEATEHRALALRELDSSQADAVDRRLAEDVLAVEILPQAGVGCAVRARKRLAARPRLHLVSDTGVAG